MTISYDSDAPINQGDAFRKKALENGGAIDDEEMFSDKAIILFEVRLVADNRVVARATAGEILSNRRFGNLEFNAFFEDGLDAESLRLPEFLGGDCKYTGVAFRIASPSRYVGRVLPSLPRLFHFENFYVQHFQVHFECLGASDPRKKNPTPFTDSMEFPITDIRILNDEQRDDVDDDRRMITQNWLGDDGFGKVVIRHDGEKTPVPWTECQRHIYNKSTLAYKYLLTQNFEGFSAHREKILCPGETALLVYKRFSILRNLRIAEGVGKRVVNVQSNFVNLPDCVNYPKKWQKTGASRNDVFEGIHLNDPSPGDVTIR